jgi:phosphoenolpyruvate phosphomutase
VDLPELAYVDNDEYDSTGELVSLQKALTAIRASDDLIVSYGDVLFNKYIPQALAEEGDDVVIALDTNWRASANRDREADYAQCSVPPGRQAFYQTVHLCRIAHDLPPGEVHGEWMGFVKIAARARAGVRAILDELLADPAHRLLKVPGLLNELVRRGQPVRVFYTSGHWLDVDSLADVTQARDFGAPA